MPADQGAKGPFGPITPAPNKALNRPLKDDRSVHHPSPRTMSKLNTSTGGDSASSAPRSTTGPPSPRAKKTKSSAQYDRFIPNRNAMDIASSQFNIARSDSEQPLDGATIAYHEEVARACGVTLNKRILAFKEEAPTSEKDDLRQVYSRPVLKTNTSTTATRRILTTPERILDAPGLIDDYYLNLIDWSVSNSLAIGLEQAVYMWNASTGDVSKLCELEGGPYIASVKWTADGTYIAIGTSDGDVQIWDAESQSKIRTMSGHQARVGVLSWERHLVSSGCRDGSIWNHDVRVAKHKIAEMVAHSNEVCGLTWRSDGALLASGGNDNLVNIWDARSSVPKFSKTQHTAAVRALAWSPWQLNLLASGGGSHDRHVHFWNTTTTARLNSIDTKSQVTSIQWSSEYRELMTSHGFPHHHLALWSYPSLTKIVDIPAHDTRVLHTTLSPDGQTLASAACDGSLKLWRIFESRTKSAKGRKEGAAAATPATTSLTGASAVPGARSSIPDMSRPSFIR
ncbi:WD repeat-containing protein slp1 [Coemansia sp. RSA 1933]|nr:WD repeat-containing protein slp1 [Coemansia sp. RSA 1933]